MILLDTDTCIHLLKGRLQTIKYLQLENIHSVAISAITHYELLFGAKHSANPEKQIEKVECLIEPFCVHAFTNKTAGFASGIKEHLSKRGEMIGAHDILIAASGLEHGLVVVTGNIREFSRVPGLKVDSWSQE